MARKTNKTDHVLNLLSSGSDKDNTDDSKTAKPQPPVQPDKAASVSVVQPSSDKEQLADAIRLSLEEELENVQETEEKADEEIEPEVPSKTEDKKENAAEEARPAESSKGNTAEPGPEPEEDLDFAYVNVMETLVQERVLEYMEQFGICTCPRCIADTSALALTQLPPKYVVVSKAAISPLMNFYSKKYAGQITVEITKACIQVGDVPHHTRN